MEVNVSRNKPDETNAYIFLFLKDKMMILNAGIGLVPRYSVLVSQGIQMSKLEKFGIYQGTPCFYGELSIDPDLPDVKFSEVRDLFTVSDEELFRVAAHAYHLMNWDRGSRFCGFCGTKTEKHPGMRAKCCPECGQIVFPRISPAVIVAITKGEQLLLARGQRFNFFSLIAGFIEPGETIEQGLKREVREEVGIEIKNLKYFASQPWPFPDSLMIGFTAEYESGELVLEETEIVEAGWFTADKMPMVPGKISIAGDMIEQFRQNKLTRI